MILSEITELRGFTILKKDFSLQDHKAGILKTFQRFHVTESYYNDYDPAIEMRTRLFIIIVPIDP